MENKRFKVHFFKDSYPREFILRSTSRSDSAPTGGGVGEAAPTGLPK
jgi:hypothetical protein